MGAQDIVDFGADHVVLATGSAWRRDGIGVVQEDAAEFPSARLRLTIFSTAPPVKGPVVIFDDDNYFMGGALAEKLAAGGP